MKKQLNARQVSLRHGRGVTLMELMVVVAILSIVATIAVPSYRRYLIRSNRVEAKIALLQLQTAQEKFYMQNNAFTADLTGASPDGLGLLATTETGKYTIEVDVPADGQSFSATATPAAGGGQQDDSECATFSINERGTRGVTGPQGAQACWR